MFITKNNNNRFVVKQKSILQFRILLPKFVLGSKTRALIKFFRARIFSEVLEIGYRSEDFIDCDPARTAVMLLTATNSLLPYSLSTKELGERKEIKEKVSRLAALLLNGILSRS